MKFKALLVLMLVSSCAFAQPTLDYSDKEGEILIGYGLGFDGGLSFTTGIAKTASWGRLGTRITVLKPYSMDNSMSSYDLLIGKVYRVNRYSASISAGVGMISGEGLDIGIPGFDFGIPVDLQLSQPTSTVRKHDFLFGLNLFGNINSRSPMIGLCLIGKMAH